MTWVHVVRGLYLLVSALVCVVAVLQTKGRPRSDSIGAFTLAAYALSIAAAMVYAFNKPLTIGTAFVGFGVGVGAAWLSSLARHK